jgi:hypothetical protein
MQSNDEKDRSAVTKKNSRCARGCNKNIYSSDMILKNSTICSIRAVLFLFSQRCRQMHSI